MFPAWRFMLLPLGEGLCQPAMSPPRSGISEGDGHIAREPDPDLLSLDSDRNLHFPS